MSLRTRFTLLVTLLGLTVAVSLGSAVWSVALLEREVSGPFASTAAVLRGLGLVKGSLEGQAATLMRPSADGGGERRESRGAPGLWWVEPGGAPAAEDLAPFEARAARTMALLGSLEESRFFAGRVGAVTARTMRRNAESALAAGRAWYATGEAQQRRAAMDTMFGLHKLIEALEARLLSDADLAVTHGRRIRGRLLVIVGLSLLNAALLSALGLTLFRRWVTRPVARLRVAAERIGAGDFDHRIEARGRDELADLSREVDSMAATIVRMQNERVERERLAAMGELLRRLSHNLRNPLAGIRGVAEVTARRLGEESPLKGNMDRIMGSVDRLDVWLKDLLASTSPMDLRASEQPVGAFLEGLAAAHRPTAHAKSLTLTLDVSGAPARAVFDRRHLEQAVTAILSNAIQATPNGGRVRVSAAEGTGGLEMRDTGGTPVPPGPDTGCNARATAGASEKEDGGGGWWRIRVEDSGPGVPEELIEKIFRAHFTTKPDGSGIGLAVAQQVVQGHGGRIHVERGQRADGEGGDDGDGLGGAVFTVVLPLVARAGAARSDGNGAVGDENSRR